MTLPSRFSRLGVIFGLALLASAVLALRLSPNWFRFLAEAREAEAAATNATHLRAIDRALASGAAERGARVIDQKTYLGSAIEDPLHQALRWRLLVPAIGRILGLSDWVTLGLAHAGCAVLILVLIALGTPPRKPWGIGGLWFALTAGATAPIITSLGWLGYYDSLFALGLLTVAFAGPRTAVILACLLTPWLDERFVLALPLALLVRLHRSESDDTKSWLQREAVVPLVLTVAFASVRLALGGTGGSQTVADYVRTFILGQEITAADRFFGAWSGLRFGWLIVLAGLAAEWSKFKGTGRYPVFALGAVALATATIGACTAQDTARSMVLVFPLIPWAWQCAASGWPRVWRWLGPVLALASLVAPAHQVYGRLRLAVPPPETLPAENPLVRAENNLGYLHDRGDNGPRNVAEARKWYTRAANAGLAEAQFNLAVLLLLNPEPNLDRTEVERWLVSAARQGVTPARRTLAFLYFGNHGFTKDLPRAWAWLSISGEPGNGAAELFSQLTPEEQAAAGRIKQSILKTKP